MRKKFGLDAAYHRRARILQARKDRETRSALGFKALFGLGRKAFWGRASECQTCHGPLPKDANTDNGVTRRLYCSRTCRRRRHNSLVGLPRRVQIADREARRLAAIEREAREWAGLP